MVFTCKASLIHDNNSNNSTIKMIIITIIIIEEITISVSGAGPGYDWGPIFFPIFADEV